MRYFIFLYITIMFSHVMAQTITPAEDEALLNVKVTDFNQKLRKGDIILFISAKTGITYKGVTGNDGTFSIAVPKADTYTIKYREYASEQEYTNFEIPDTKSKVVFEVTIQIELPKTYILDNVFFDTGKATLKSESNKALNDLYEVMKYKETLYIEISGHTDNVGGEDLNKKLSQDRADAVRNYLVKKGIAPDRIIAKGYWFTEPIADNDTDEGRAKNRRTEVRVIKE